MKKLFRNKDCIECPKNKREDVVWQKGYLDGFEVSEQRFKKIFGKLYWKKY